MLRLLIGTFLCIVPGWAQFNGFYFKCSSAMVCVERSFCDQIGVISKSAITLTEEEEKFRMPILPCLDSARGSTGFCCRDPDYKDDWPIDSSTIKPGPPISGGGDSCKDPFIKLSNGKCGCKPPLKETPDGKCECKPPAKPTIDGGCECIPPGCRIVSIFK